MPETIKIEVPRPRPGRKIYVPTKDGYLGGLGTLSLGVGNIVHIQEAPGIAYDWVMLVQHQLQYVEIYGGSKVRQKLQKVG